MEIANEGLESYAAKRRDAGEAAPHAPPYKPIREAWVLVLAARFVAWLFMQQWFMWVIRICWPIPRLAGWAAVSRYDDVAEVLSRHDVFKVPFADEIARLNDVGEDSSTEFTLGIDDEAKHDRQQMQVMKAFRRDDLERITSLSRECANKAVGGFPGGKFDAIEKLITGVPLHLCSEYYGVDVPGDPQSFADATFDVSGHLFGPPPIFGTPQIKRRASVDEAATYIRSVVDRAIVGETQRQKSGKPVTDDKVLPRLVKMHLDDPKKFTQRHVRAFLMGMIVGFVPTNTLAGGHVLEMLLNRKEFMDAACGAVAAGDDDLLERALFEAMRFMPHNFGSWRICSRDYTVAAGTRRAATIRKDAKVLVWTMSAMFDPSRVDRPRKFDPHRPASDYMLLGFGMHWCVGAFIARTQITQTFKALLSGPKLKPAGRPQLRGLFPEHRFVEFDAVKR
jgi:cytochrome P450